MAQIVCGMKVELPVVRVSDIVEVVRTRFRHSVNLFQILFRNEVCQVAVVGFNEVLQQVLVLAVGDKLVNLVHKHFLLVIEQVFVQFAKSIAPLKCVAFNVKFPKEMFVLLHPVIANKGAQRIVLNLGCCWNICIRWVLGVYGNVVVDNEGYYRQR